MGEQNRESLVHARPEVELVTRRCGCGRPITDETALVRGHHVTADTKGASCPECDYQSYLGSPGA